MGFLVWNYCWSGNFLFVGWASYFGMVSVLMKEEDLTKGWRKLSLSERESWAVSTDVGQTAISSKGEHCLLLKLLTNKYYNKEALKLSLLYGN